MWRKNSDTHALSLVFTTGILLFSLLTPWNCSANKFSSLLYRIKLNSTRNAEHDNNKTQLSVQLRPHVHDNNETALRSTKNATKALRPNVQNYDLSSKTRKTDEVKRHTYEVDDYSKIRWVWPLIIFGVIGIGMICCFCADPDYRSFWIENMLTCLSNHPNTISTIEAYVEPSPTESIVNEIRQRHERLFGLPFPHIHMTRPPLLLEDNPPEYPGLSQSLDHTDPPPSYTSAWARQQRDSIFTM